MRVLHVVTHMNRGGLESMIMNYYRHINRDKIQFDFLVHREETADFDSEILEMGGQIYHIPKLNPFSLRYYKAMNDFFSNHPYKVVHSHLNCMSGYSLRAAKKHDVKTRIAHSHNTNQERNFKYIIKKFSKKMIPFYATDLFACGEDAGLWLFDGKDFEILNNAIDAEKYSFCMETSHKYRKELNLENNFVIGHIGRFNSQKNHVFLIDIFFEILKQEPSARLVLVGDGADRKVIEEKAKKLEIRDKILFLGVRSDIPELLQAIDVFLFPSLYEGLSLVTIEAQAAGIPCIVSDTVTKQCKLVENFEFVPLEYSAKSWAEQVLKYRDSKKVNTYDIIAAAGYDVKRNVKKLEDFYLSVEK